MRQPRLQRRLGIQVWERWNSTDPGENFYFMEMNTRLQVEHPVTGDGHRYRFGEVADSCRRRNVFGLYPGRYQISGHAIECRINAENPEPNFRPSCGKISLLHIPGGPGFGLIRHCTRIIWYRRSMIR